ncbi:ABC transporter permease [Streptococcus suis]
MKRPIHLYIFVALSAIASLLRVYNAFFSHYNEEAMLQLVQSAPSIDENFLIYTKEAIGFQTNLINKVLAALLLLIVVATIVFLFMKKNEQASFTYLGYVFGALLFNTYAFIGGKGLVSIFTDELTRQGTSATLMGGYIVNIVLFVIYFGVTVFFHLRKPKEKPNAATNATDI